MICPYVLQMIVSPKLRELVLYLEHRVTWNVMVGLQLKQVAPALRTFECEVGGPMPPMIQKPSSHFLHCYKPERKLQEPE